MKKCFTFILCMVLMTTFLSGCSLSIPDIFGGSGQTGITINSPEELIAHLNRQRECGVYETTVQYSQELSESEFDLLLDCTSVMHMGYTARGNEYTFTMTPYPGERIANAYFSQNTSGLNSDEIQALQIAQQMVSQAKEKTSDPFELELLLHDMLLDKTEYYSGSTDIDDVKNPPRHLTVVGALLDGRANCQGYTDGFYTLATMAGFTVDRMSGTLDGQPHMFNIIQLDGSWYIVDPTSHDNDSSDTAEYTYPYFNAGLDHKGDLDWEALQEHRSIAQTSSSSYYYNFKNGDSRHNYEKTYDDIDDLARFAIKEYTQNNRKTIHLMLEGESASKWEISNALDLAGRNVDWSFSYTYWYVNAGDNTYITVQFS